MKQPEIIVYKKQENKFYLMCMESDLCIGPFKTVDEARKHIDVFAEIVLEETYSPLYEVD